MVNESGDSGFEGISILVGAIPKQFKSTRRTTDTEECKKTVLAFDDIYLYTVYSGLQTMALERASLL